MLSFFLLWLPNKTCYRIASYFCETELLLNSGVWPLGAEASHVRSRDVALSVGMAVTAWLWLPQRALCSWQGSPVSLMEALPSQPCLSPQRTRDQEWRCRSSPSLNCRCGLWSSLTCVETQPKRSHERGSSVGALLHYSSSLGFLPAQVAGMWERWGGQAGWRSLPAALPTLLYGYIPIGKVAPWVAVSRGDVPLCLRLDPDLKG